MEGWAVVDSDWAPVQVRTQHLQRRASKFALIVDATTVPLCMLLDTLDLHLLQ